MRSGDESQASQNPASPAERLAEHPSAWASFWQTLVRFEATKVSPWLGLRNTIGFALPLAVGAAVGEVSTGLVIATGALNVSFSDGFEPYPQRARRMLAASLVVGLAVIAGSVSGGYPLLAVLIAGTWAFAAGMMVALSTQAADLGTVSLVTLLVFAAVPMAPEKAVIAGLLACGGGLLQTTLALALWPLRRYGPERQALGALYAELARAAAAPVHASQAPPASAQSTQARSALSTLERDHSVESDRFRSLLNQAERIRLSLLALARVHARIRREHPGSPEERILERYFEHCARVLRDVADSLHGGEPAAGEDGQLDELRMRAEELRTRPGPATAMMSGARHQLDALTGQLRSAFDLAAHATPSGAAEFERRESRKPWYLRLSGSLAILRANLTLNSAAFRHAIRLAGCVAIGDALGRALDLHRSYWLPMTIAIVLKPDFTATFSRGVLRLAGTFAGLVMATALFHALHPSLAMQLGLISAFMFALRSVGSANYGILVAAVTGLVVLLVAMTGVSPAEVIAARGINTAAGGLIALTAYWLWPTWERTHVPEAMARMLDAYRDYFRAIRQTHLGPPGAPSPLLDRTRAAARLARSDLEVSIDRLSAEPGVSTGAMAAFNNMLASSHRLIHAVMALEAGLHGAPVRAPEAFARFANDVELTLYYLSAALRGSPIAPRDLPDLREDHNALVHGGPSAPDPHAFVNVETDRITNSLNSLSEQLMRGMAAGLIAKERAF